MRGRLEAEGLPQKWLKNWHDDMPKRKKTSGWEQLGMLITLIILVATTLGLTYSWDVLDALSTGKVYGAQLEALVAKQASNCNGGINSEVQGLRICFILAVSLLVFEFLGLVATVETWLSTCNDPAWESRNDQPHGNGCIGQCLWWSILWALVKAYHLCCCCCCCFWPQFLFNAVHRMAQAVFIHSMTLFKVVAWLWGLVGVAQVLLYACLLNKVRSKQPN
ncbi:hypothetical protein V8C86DRAFT_69398 [Haematococcus lacustris]